jgi:hypothetical protein
LQKVLAVKAPRYLYTLAMSQVSYKERTKTMMVTKNWTSTVGLSRVPNNGHENFLLTNGDFSWKNFNILGKMHVAMFLKADQLFYFISNVPMH